MPIAHGEITLKPQCTWMNFLFLFFDFRERGRQERKKHQFVVTLIYASIGCFLYEPATLVYQDDALTN